MANRLIAASLVCAAALGMGSTGEGLPGMAHAQPPDATTSTPERITIPAGSVIRMRTVEEISSKTARKGDLVKLEVAHDFKHDGVTAIRAGTPAVAELTLAEKKGWMGRSGKLEARMLYLDLPTGAVRISGKLGDDGQSNEGVATVLSLFTGFGFVTGKSAVVPAGTEIATRLDRSARLLVLEEATADTDADSTADSSPDSATEQPVT